VRQKNQFREDYVTQLSSIIEGLEKSNQSNTEIVEKFLCDYSFIQEQTLDEIHSHSIKLKKDVQDMQLKDSVTKYISNLPKFDVRSFSCRY
jgi:Asp-tRNA(Asn)/Glu-tRNA(Gln) amidotransferase C subunit